MSRLRRLAMAGTVAGCAAATAYKVHNANTNRCRGSRSSRWTFTFA